MTAVAGIALQINHRTVLGLESTDLRFLIRVARETNQTRFVLHKFCLVSAVSPVALKALAFDKRRMGRCPLHFCRQILMATQTEYPFFQGFLEESLTRSAMRVMTSTAGPPAERLVGIKSAQLRLGLLVAAIAEIFLRLNQQIFAN